MLNDVLIFNKVRNGDISAFESLFRSYYKPLCQYACKYVTKMDVAEEIVQELFYKLWKDRENLQVVFSAKSYLYGAVRNNSLQYLEYLIVRKNYADTVTEQWEEAWSSTPEEQLEYTELQEHFNRALEQLPERRKKIFRMNRFEGKKYTEIAQELSLSVKTIEAEMTKALHTLRKSLEDYTYS